MAVPKVKAAALQFAILVSVIVGVLLASFLTLTHTHRFFARQSDNLLESLEASRDGIYLTTDHGFSINDSISTDTERGYLKIEQKTWGGFSLIESTSVVGSKGFTTRALTGAKTQQPPIALWTSEKNLPLVLVGKSRIEGNAHVSDRGIKAGVISGNYFNGDQLIFGQMKANNGMLPELDPIWIERTQELLESSRYLISNFDIEESNSNSFANGPKVFTSSDTLVLDQEIIGNIIIASTKGIKVTASSKIQDVLLVAPSVVVENGFRGNLHLLASKQVKLEENTNLGYPSSLVVINDGTLDDESNPMGKQPIVVSANAQISGNIIYLNDGAKDNRGNTDILFGENAQVIGQVYCRGFTELKGTVTGNVYTDGFISNAKGSRYINHIYGGNILAHDLPKGFCGLPLRENRKGVAQWLY